MTSPLGGGNSAVVDVSRTVVDVVEVVVDVVALVVDVVELTEAVEVSDRVVGVFERRAAVDVADLVVMVADRVVEEELPLNAVTPDEELPFSGPLPGAPLFDVPASALLVLE